MSPHPAGCRSDVDVRQYAFELPAAAASVCTARRLTRSRLTRWDLCEDVCETATLVMSELVTNAVVHTASELIMCELHNGERNIRIAVRDQGFGTRGPLVRRTPPADEHGRGLLLVAAVSSAWGTHEVAPGSGLVVWAELPHSAEPAC
ncbi:ATP-binding protein [Streptomyces sp. GC420]|uniref:ATP-binding protein n=1 Tax=Streptomyces sp. GC420 TaxID=2697568 RepID=UPI001414E19F|nr:ATP-binding protein [Streptomyces sp. GC420]NBM16946.1 ATP-binding protein [Streptomyces sp. GC420]